MTTLDLFVHGQPRTKGSWRPVMAGGKPRLIPQTAEKPWALTVAWAAREKRPTLVPKPHAVSVELHFAFVSPKKPTNQFPTGDSDKLARSCLDALTGICWTDDVQVSELLVTKRYGAEPGVHIVVRAQESISSRQNAPRDSQTQST